MAVNGAVAERSDHPRLAEHGVAGRLLEARLVDQRREIVLIGQLERRVAFECPLHRQLERASRVEAGGARIGIDGGFCMRGGVVDRQPFTLQEAELAHLRSFDFGTRQLPAECAVLERIK